jgi:FlaA1/EpsC-like NDP-sugar epimerase
VVPLFRRQIQKGGPVTLTHADVTRFFMTISEASQLVIQAGAMAEGGEIYLLDMGEAIRVFDLAKAMIELSGLTVRDEANPDGDIEVIEVGLRPGEKLYEELLIGEDAQPTPHPRIVKAHEAKIDWALLQPRMQDLDQAIQNRDVAKAMDVLRLLVPGFRTPKAKLADPAQPQASDARNLAVN